MNFLIAKKLFCMLIISSILSNTALISAQADTNQSTQTIEIIIISSHGCRPCKRLKDELDILIQLSGGIIPTILYIENRAHLKALKDKFGIRIEGTPTTLVIINGSVILSFTGYSSAQTWWQKIEPALQRYSSHCSEPAV